MMNTKVAKLKKNFSSIIILSVSIIVSCTFLFLFLFSEKELLILFQNFFEKSMQEFVVLFFKN